MLLLNLISTVFAGGPTAWNPSTHPLETIVHPITVRTVQGPSGYTRLEIVNNLPKDLQIDLWTASPEDEGAGSWFRMLKEQGDALCPPPATDAERTADYPRCYFTLPAAGQQDIVIVFSPRGPSEDAIGEVTINAMHKTDDAVDWSYLVEKPLIGKNTPAE